MNKKIKISKYQILVDILTNSSWACKKNAISAIMDHYFEPAYLKSQPLFLQIEPTTHCNLTCQTCWNPNRNNKSHLSFENFIKIIEQFPFIRKINLVGMGEPLLNPELTKMINMLRDKNIAVGIASNGMFLTEEKSRKLLEAGISWINISIDSSDEIQFQKLRPGADIKLIIQQFKTFLSLKRESGYKVETGIATVIGTHNLNCLESIIELAAELEVDKLFLQTIHFWGNNKFKNEWTDQSLVQNAHQFKYQLRNAKQKANQLGLKFILENTPDTACPRFCKWPWKSAYITAEGYVTPCCMHGANPDTINFGNILQESFTTIWNNHSYQEFRRQLKSPNPPDICRDCPSYYKPIRL